MKTRNYITITLLRVTQAMFEQMLRDIKDIELGNLTFEDTKENWSKALTAATPTVKTRIKTLMIEDIADFLESKT